MLFASPAALSADQHVVHRFTCIAWLRVVTLCLFVLMVSAPDATSATSDFVFTKVADTGTTVPGTGQHFSSFAAAAFDGQQVVFHATKSGGGQGIYLWDGSIEPVADSSTTIPGAGGNFNRFREVSIDEGNVTFFGGNASREGVYTTLGGTLRRVVDSTMSTPNSSATYDPLWTQTDSALDLTLHGNEIIFSASSGEGTAQESRGVYLESAGTIGVVADTNTAPPGNANAEFTRFSEVDLNDGDLLFAAELDFEDSWGFYTSVGAAPNALRKAIDQDTPIPGLPSPTFQFLPNTIQIDDGNLFFVSSFIFRNGIYRERSGVVTTIADESRTDPSTGNPFSSFGGVFSVDDRTTVFVAASASTSLGIYFDRQGALVDVINQSGNLDGKPIDGVGLFAESMVDDSILFSVDFSDGSDALYLATLLNLRPTLAGDYNRNGAVDAPDSSLWRDTFGSTTDLRADGNANGRVDAPDYTIWRNNFGKTRDGLLVPEPTGALPWLVALLFVLVRRREWTHVAGWARR